MRNANKAEDRTEKKYGKILLQWMTSDQCGYITDMQSCPLHVFIIIIYHNNMAGIGSHGNELETNFNGGTIKKNVLVFFMLYAHGGWGA